MKLGFTSAQNAPDVVPFPHGSKEDQKKTTTFVVDTPRSNVILDVVATELVKEPGR